MGLLLRRCTDGHFLHGLWLGFGEGLGGHVFRNKLGGKTAYRVHIGNHGLGIVLRFIAGTAGLAGDDESAFP